MKQVLAKEGKKPSLKLIKEGRDKRTTKPARWSMRGEPLVGKQIKTLVRNSMTKT